MQSPVYVGLTPCWATAWGQVPLSAQKETLLAERLAWDPIPGGLSCLSPFNYLYCPILFLLFYP